jgi:hypothetical protein
MNERIQELAEQAAKQHGHTIKFTPEITETLDTFAELIVKECGVALSPMLRDMVSRGQAYNLIKQHFGVK